MEKGAFDVTSAQLETAYEYFPEPKKLRLEKAEPTQLLRKRPINPTTQPKKKSKSKTFQGNVKVSN